MPAHTRGSHISLSKRLAPPPDLSPGALRVFKDLVATSNGVDFSYAGADRKRLLVKSWTPGGAVTPKHDLTVPYSAGADTTFYANFVENRPSDLVANTIDYETRKTNHAGKWPVFSIRN